MARVDIQGLELTQEEADVLGQALISVADFGQMFMPDAFHTPFNRLHKPILPRLDAIMNHPGEHNYAIAAPRGVGKTTILRAFAILAIIRRRYNFIVYIGNTEVLAMQQTENIKYEMKNNKFIADIFGEPEVSHRTGLSEEFSKKSWVAYGDVVIVPRGYGQQLRGLNWRGHRPGLFIFDDMEERAACRSDTYREGFRRWVASDVWNCVDPYKDDYARLWIDTVKHEDAYLERAMNDERWQATRIAACTEVRTEKENGEEEEISFVSNEPAFKTDAQLALDYRTLKAEGLEDVFYMEMMNVAKAGSQASFHEDMFRYYTPGANGAYHIWSNKYARFMRRNLLRYAPAIFPATAEKYADTIYMNEDVQTFLILDPAKTINLKSADSGFVVLSISTRSPYKLVRYAKGHRLGPADIMEKMGDLVRRFSVQYVVFEVTSLNKWISDPIRNYCALHKLNVELIEVHAKGDKLERIGALSYWYAKLIMLHDFHLTRKLAEQILQYPYSALLDVADALSHFPAALHTVGVTIETERSADQGMHYAALQKYLADLQQSAEQEEEYI